MMRKFFALLLTLMLTAAFLAVPAAALNQGGGVNGTKNDDGSGTVVNQEKTELTIPTDPSTAPPEETTAPTEATTAPEETAAETTVPSEPTTLPTEPTEAPVTVSAETKPSEPEPVPSASREPLLPTDRNTDTEAGDPMEMLLLVGLIAGLGAICVVLLIRKVLDL